MAGALWKAFVFGVVVAGAIGPIALLIFATAAGRGFPAGASAGLGAALADLIYAFTAFSIGALLLPHFTAYGAAIRVGFSLLLVVLGGSILVRQFRKSVIVAADRSGRGAFLPTFLLTLVNPMTLVMFAGIVPQLPVAGSFANAASLAAALAAGSLLVNEAIAAAGAGLGTALRGSGWRRAITAVAAAGILAFGLYGLIGAR
jgi:threonine/homoserine/homoserine lactone efflux protein